MASISSRCPLSQKPVREFDTKLAAMDEDGTDEETTTASESTTGSIQRAGIMRPDQKLYVMIQHVASLVDKIEEQLDNLAEYCSRERKKFRVRRTREFLG